MKENPSPTAFVYLAQVYINLAKLGETLRVAEEGLLLFPRSVELKKVHRFARQKHLKQQAEETREKISRHATPEHYHELAEVFLEMGDQDTLIQTCAECIRQFPDDTEAYFLVAEARIQTFYRNLKAEEGLKGLRSLMKVLEVDRQNERAHRKLGELLFRVGAAAEAKRHFEYLASHDLLDEDGRILLEECVEAAESQQSIEALLANVEQRGALPNRSAGGLKRQKAIASDEAVASIRDGLQRLVAIEGVQKAAYIRGSKALVKGEIRSGKDPFLKSVRVVSKAAQRVARRMDLGNFSKGILDGDFGHMCLCSFGDVTAAVQCVRGTPTDPILMDIQELVAGSLFVRRNSGKRKAR